MSASLRFVVLGLSLSSSWGNGHATTWRALLAALARQGHRVLFLERETPWYAAHRDLRDPSWCDLRFYASVDELAHWRGEIAAADVVIVGSYVPEGVAVIARVQRWARGTVAFYDIDTPVTLARLERGDREYLAPELIPDFDLYLSFTGGPTLGVLERHWGARRARALYCSVDPNLYRPTGATRRWDLGYLGTYSPDRQPSLERLLIAPARRMPQQRFVVAGSLYPDDIDWPPNVERIPHLPPDAHADFYAAQAWTLNITRADMRAAGYSPSVRLFEAAACGAPVLTDAWPGLETILRPDLETLVMHTTEDVIRALALPEARRTAMAIAARAHVLSAHTADRRARELLAHVRAVRQVLAEAS